MQMRVVIHAGAGADKMDTTQEIIELRAKLKLLEKQFEKTLDTLEKEGILRKEDIA